VRPPCAPSGCGLGHVIGSNMFNLLGIWATSPALVGPVPGTRQFLDLLTFGFIVGAALLMIPLVFFRRRLSRAFWEAFGLRVLFAVYRLSAAMTAQSPGQGRGWRVWRCIWRIAGTILRALTPVLPDGAERSRARFRAKGRRLSRCRHLAE